MMLRLHALPAFSANLLEELRAPPRLVAHLRLVHDVAVRLVSLLRKRWPRLSVDAQAVAFGASLHDVGKAVVHALDAVLERLARDTGERLQWQAAHGL